VHARISNFGSRPSPLSRTLPKSGPFPPPALPGFDGTMDLSDSPRRPGLSLAGVRLGPAPTAWGLPCCVRSPVADMPSPIPRWDRSGDRFAPLKATTAAFPMVGQGRLPHYDFRGLLGVHSRYGLPTRGTALRSFPSKAPAMLLPPSPLRLLPAGAKVAGWELHPLKTGALSRRTLPRSWFKSRG
jgi:hypothetical protein